MQEGREPAPGGDGMGGQCQGDRTQHGDKAGEMISIQEATDRCGGGMRDRKEPPEGVSLGNDPLSEIPRDAYPCAQQRQEPQEQGLPFDWQGSREKTGAHGARQQEEKAECARPVPAHAEPGLFHEGGCPALGRLMDGRHHRLILTVAPRTGQ